MACPICRALVAACKRLLDECPFQCDVDRCECGENGNGFDDAGNPCEHIQGRRAIALAEAAEAAGLTATPLVPGHSPVYP